ncbi:MFS general substrate transporter [Dothidotthia symphoricarpi CBS 119687]|uniref:MFS general substrate transporter n=1 Tax=Dothidotthia symphoricarpi CBS 119687 TaxID=1392245 RepID=A0A6A6AKV3_9PLEO|nr:MFS general substrate transporter [Dothidotthia symphoricarpi CBS 119687]KAF2132196.1 MFS general substrate transporter [Dothidotthia symphoricarpi CBS 119687]
MTKKSSSDLPSRRTSESTADTESCCIKENEGNRAAWLTVLGSVLVYYSSFGIMNSFGFFQNFYTSDFLEHTSPPTIAFIGTLQIALMNSLAAISGALCDYYGIKYLYIGSGIGTIVALLALSFAKSGQFWQVFLAQGLLMGLTIAFAIQPALTVVGQHFKERRAFAMGLVTTGSALGGIGFPLMFEKLLPVLGFSWALRVAALKIAVCYSIALGISTSKPSGKSIRRNCGSLLDFRGFLDTRYSVLCIGAFFCQAGQWIPSYYIKTYANAAYPGNPIADYFLPLMNSCSVVGAVIGGLTGDRIGRLNSLWPMVLMTGCSCLFIWLLIDSLIALVVFACLFGFSTGNFVALIPPVIGQITPDDKLGARIGAFYSVVAISSLVGTPIGGALITDDHSKEGYRWLICFALGWC